MTEIAADIQEIGAYTAEIAADIAEIAPDNQEIALDWLKIATNTTEIAWTAKKTGRHNREWPLAVEKSRAVPKATSVSS